MTPGRSVDSLLVLGGGSDIGLAIARRLVDEGTRSVVLAARHPETLGTAVDELQGAGGGARITRVGFDAADLASHPAFVEDVFASHGAIDVVVVAFGLLGHGARFDRQRVLSLLEANLVGAVSIVLETVERMRRQGRGTVVVLSSVAGERVRKTNFGYGASKAGLDGFCQGLGDALAGTGVDVMIVRPGFVRTKMTAGLDAPPLSTTADEVAAEVVRGLRRGSLVVWVPRSLRWVMAVARHLPRSVFRRLPY
ncbi:MAG: SDR family NAD(P)-dependent oxidoreductase [Acidimicrobiia bacterium]|nr:SDR family NAD(P)-dependent oxidoreductase [Acidimicrobiia bacterium]